MARSAGDASEPPEVVETESSYPSILKGRTVMRCFTMRARWDLKASSPSGAIDPIDQDDPRTGSRLIIRLPPRRRGESEG